MNKALSNSPPVTHAKFGPNYVKSSCYFLLIFYLGIASLLYNSFLLQVLIVLSSFANVDPVSNIGIKVYQFRNNGIRAKVDEGRYVKDGKFYDKI